MAKTDTQFKVSAEQLAPFFNEVSSKADKVMQLYLIGNFFFGLFLALFYSTWTIALLVGGLSIVAYYLTKAILPKSSLYQYVGSAVTAVFTMQFIYQMHGMFEMHFFVFIASIVLIVYQKWKLQLPLLILIVAHHAIFAYLQYTGMKEIYFTQLNYITLQTFLFHAGLAALIIFISGYWSYDYRNKTVNGAMNTIFMETQLQSMNKNVSFAEEIIKGNLEATLEVAENDDLGRSLINMREGLRKSYEREQQEKFTNIGLAQVSEILRNNMNDIDKLCDEVIAKVVKYVNANQGGLFILEGELDNDIHILLKSCYAYDKKKYLEKRIEIGQGLVGQAYLEKSTIHLTEVPDSYVNITSGLGAANPTSILVIPLKSNEEIVGVLELASLKKFNSYEISFLEKIGESIASTIVSVKTNERTRKLLEHSRIQTEEMRSQEEEMRQNMEELSATQEEMHRKEQEIRQMLDAAKQNESALKAEVESLRKQLKQS
jgi:methyl-accepting chemotaxis protein